MTWSTILPDRFDRNSGTVRALDRVGGHTAVVYRLVIDPKPATILAGDGTVAEMISAAGSYVRVYDDHGAVLQKHEVHGAKVESIVMAPDRRLGLYLGASSGAVTVDGAAVPTQGSHAVVGLTPAGGVQFTTRVVALANVGLDVQMAYAGSALIVAGNPIRGLNFPYAWVSSIAPSGAVSWSRQIRGVNASTLSAMAVDGAGNVAVAGELWDPSAMVADPASPNVSLGTVSADRSFLARFGPDGTFAFSRDLGTGTTPCVAAVGSDQWLVTTGRVMKAAGPSALQRLDAAGTALWAVPWPERFAARALAVTGDEVRAAGIVDASASLGGAQIAAGSGLLGAYAASDGAFRWAAAWPNVLDAQTAAGTAVVAGMGPIAGAPASKGAVGPTMAVFGLP